jgi:adenylylsulfate kinase
MFGPDFGFSGKDRLSVVKALVHLALKTSRMGFPVVVSALTAHEDARDYIRKIIDRLVVVYTDCSLDECIRRDPKGIYKRAIASEIDTVIGYNSPYVKPESVALTVHSDHIPPVENAGHIVTYLIENRLI